MIIYITAKGGKRDPKVQEELFFAYGGKVDEHGNYYWPETVPRDQRKEAVPGTSWHEIGLAIDGDKEMSMWLRSFEDVPLEQQTRLSMYGLSKPLYTDETERIDESDYFDPSLYRYYYKNLGLSFLFEVGTEYPCAISCFGEIRYRSVSSGMSFEEIKKQLGETEVTIIPVYGTDENWYQLKYYYDDFYIVFESVEPDGSGSSMTFYCQR